MQTPPRRRHGRDLACDRLLTGVHSHASVALNKQLTLTRRQFFGTSGIRLGGLALCLLAGRVRGRLRMSAPAVQRSHPPLPGLPHFPPKAEHLIYLHMNGGPAQLDLWDYKPDLAALFDKDLPDTIRMGQRITTMTSGQIASAGGAVDLQVRPARPVRDVGE